MSFSKRVYVIILCVMTRTTVAETDVLQRDLPISESQFSELAEQVCFDLSFNLSLCQENFNSSKSDVFPRAPKVQIKCQSDKSVTFKIKPSKHWQLVVLVPNDDDLINYSLMEANEEIGRIPTPSSENFTFWTAVLNDDGSRSLWLRGPVVRQLDSNIVPKNYEIKPHHEYKNGSSTIKALFTWNSTDETDSCYDVTNHCNKKSLGDFFQKKIEPDDSRMVEISNLPLDDECVFIVRGKYGVTKFTYHTPVCNELEGCAPIPEIPKKVSINAREEASGDSWEVFVSWLRPQYEPSRYNVTLRTDDVRTLAVPGNTTEVTFTNVSGAGLYNVSVVAFTPSGTAHTSRRALFPAFSTGVRAAGPAGAAGAAAAAAAWCAALAAAAALATVALCWRRRRANQLRRLYFQGLEDKLPKECGSDVIGQESGVAEDSWEVRSERLLLHEVIGEGAFGVVRRGTLAPAGREVAVKMLKDFPSIEEIRSFRTEMELMKSVGAHPHVVSLVGCCSGRRPLIIAEYCSRGDLLSYLRLSWDVMVSKRNAKYYNNNTENSDYRNDLFKSKPQKEQPKIVVNKLYDLHGVCDAELTSVDLLSFCRQIAMGMEFLASNRVVHRDLAARNILVSGDKTLKIADFGLSRDVYQENQYKQKGNGKMPVKWMALESLTHRIYTTQSDVWSFGVVIWEVVTVGAAPYPEVPVARLLRLLRAGYRMPRPNNCSKQLYEVMLSCWRARPRDRPTFADLHRQLDSLLNTACADEYLSLEIDADDAAPPTPRAQRYVQMITRAKRPRGRGESYERPLKAPQSNHYTSPPATFSRPQIL